MNRQLFFLLSQVSYRLWKPCEATSCLKCVVYFRCHCTGARSTQKGYQHISSGDWLVQVFTSDSSLDPYNHYLTAESNSACFIVNIPCCSLQCVSTVRLLFLRCSFCTCVVAFVVVLWLLCCGFRIPVFWAATRREPHGQETGERD